MPASSSITSKLNPKPALQPPTTCYSTPIRDHKPASQSKPPKNHILHKIEVIKIKVIKMEVIKFEVIKIEVIKIEGIKIEVIKIEVI